MRSWPLLSLALLLAPVAGCGGSSSGTTPVNPPQTYPTLSGNWTVSATSNLTGATYLLGGSITDSGATVTATLQALPDESGCLPTGQPIPFTGSVTTSGAISLTSAVVASQTISISGSTLGSGLITGTYRIAGGCAAGDSGTIEALVEPSFTGTYTGTMQPTSGTSVDVSATIVQAGPNADGEFGVTGTVEFSGSSCFTSGTITSSTVLGEYIQATMSTDKGGSVQITALGIAVPQVTEIEGAYQVTAGPCAGASGTVNVTS